MSDRLPLKAASTLLALIALAGAWFMLPGSGPAAVGCAARAALTDNLSLVTLPSLTVVSLLAWMLLLAGVAAILRQVFVADGVAWRPTAAWLATLFVVVFSAKLFLLRDNQVTAPFWDQWDAEARMLFVPFNDCGLTWSRMFSLHNEHRIFFTRLLALDLLTLNGQWDPRLEQVVNATIHAGTACLLAAILWLENRRRRVDLLCLICAFTFAAPFAWDNTLMGFQSAFYFLLVFSIPALALTQQPVGTGPWWLGWYFAVCALFTSAGGVTTALAIAGVFMLRLLCDFRAWRDALANLAAATAVIVLGVMVASPPLPAHEPLRAKTLAELAGAFGHNLAWPWIDVSLMSVVVWMPVLITLAVIAWRRAQSTSFERLTLGLGAWVVMNAAAIAYGRGAGGGYPATRYMDFLSIGLAANAAMLVAFLDQRVASKVVWRTVSLALFTWFVVAAAGLDRLTQRSLADLGVWRQFYAAHATNVRLFIANGDRQAFLARRGPEEIPYPDAQSLAATLEDPFIQRILPGTIRGPIHLENVEAASRTFVIDGSPVRQQRDPLRPVWGSYSERGRAAQGQFTSQILPGCHAGELLAFDVSGYLGTPRQHLAIRDVRSDREIPVAPPRIPGESWLTIAVTCPARPFVVVAVDAEPESWFAFREPVRVGRLSLAGEHLIAWSRELFLVALACVGVCLKLTKER